MVAVAPRHLHVLRRRYYYSYYGAYEDPEVARLKSLSALPLWAGHVVHDTLERLLKEREALPSVTEQEAIVKAAVHEQMLHDWRRSEEGGEGFRLFEHEYAQPVRRTSGWWSRPSCARCATPSRAPRCARPGSRGAAAG